MGKVNMTSHEMDMLREGLSLLEDSRRKRSSMCENAGDVEGQASWDEAVQEAVELRLKLEG